MHPKQPKSKDRTEIIYGLHPLREALDAGRRTFQEVLYSQSRPKPSILKIIEQAAQLRIPVKQIKADDLKRLVGNDHHQGIAASVSKYPLANLDNLPLQNDPGRPPFIVLLDSVEDPHNLGAIARSALCFGVDHMVIPKDRCAPPSPAASKASAGALEHIRLTQVANLVQTIKILKDKGFWIVGLDHHGNSSVTDFDFSGPIGMVLGGEDKGIRKLVQQNCDYLISIPQSGPVNSLNASVAGSVVLYEACRQRLEIAQTKQ